MNFLVGADLHGVSTAPRYRIDNYLETFLGKITWIVKTANKNKATILFAGDIFDSALVSTGVINAVMEILKKAKHGIYAVYGQHDLLHHHDETLIKSPLRTLELGGVLTIVDNKHPVVLNDEIEIYGAGFEQKIPPINDGGLLKILLIHLTVTESDPPWFLEEAVSSADLMNAHPNFDYIISGDYHIPHQAHIPERKQTLINCGSLMRKDKGQINHKPKVYLINTDDLSFKSMPVPIEPPEKVFDLERITYEEEKGITIDTSNLVDFMQEGAKIPEYDKLVLQMYEQLADKVTVPKQLIIEIMDESV